MDYVEPGGQNPVAKWLSGLPDDAQGAIATRLLAMEALPRWSEKWATKLASWEGLIELRISFNRVQYRPLGVYQPGRVFVLLTGAIEKGDEIPRRHLETADRRRKNLMKEPHRVRLHEY